MTDNPPKPRTTSFFPLRKLKDNQPILKKPAVHLVHLEEEYMQVMMKTKTVTILAESKELWKSLWYAWQGL